MQIPADQIHSKEQVGTVDGDPVWQLATNGGFHIVVRAHKSGKTTVLGTGSHRAIATHIAKKHEPKFIVTALKKSEYPLSAFAHLLPRWEAVTETMRQIQAGE